MGKVYTKLEEWPQNYSLSEYERWELMQNEKTQEEAYEFIDTLSLGVETWPFTLDKEGFFTVEYSMPKTGTAFEKYKEYKATKVAIDEDLLELAVLMSLNGYDVLHETDALGSTFAWRKK